MHASYNSMQELINSFHTEGRKTTNNAKVGAKQWHITVLVNCGVDSWISKTKLDIALREDTLKSQINGVPHKV